MNERKCPICGKPADTVLRPFCSKRCADIDLGRWFKGSYAIPAAAPGEDGLGDDGEGDPEVFSPDED